MIQIHSLLLLLVVLPNTVIGVCLKGWIKDRIGDKCYKLFSPKKSWNEARKECTLHQSKLAEVKDFNTNDFIQNNFEGKAWIGSHRCSGETCFLNNEYVPYTPYAPNEPDLKSDQQSANQTAADLKENDFAILILTNGWWADEPKHNQYPYICEMPGDKPKDDIYTSCKSAFEKISNAQNGSYKIKTPTSDGYTIVYCQMTTLQQCSPGGWTLVMKANGNKETFQYDSDYWSNKNPYNVKEGQAVFDDEETKLPTYWSMPFTKICLGMKVNGHFKFISFPYKASSMYDLIADRKYREANIGRSNWLSLIQGSMLQRYCNKQGFNVDVNDYMKVRIGILGNNEKNCITPDSFLGFGSIKKKERTRCNMPNTSNSVGNAAYCRDGKRDIEKPAMGYIFVQ